MKVTPPESEHPDYLTQAEGQRLLGVKKSTFSELIKKHDIQVCTLTRRRLYRRSDLVALIEGHMVSPNTARSEDFK